MVEAFTFLHQEAVDDSRNVAGVQVGAGVNEGWRKLGIPSVEISKNSVKAGYWIDGSQR